MAYRVGGCMTQIFKKMHDVAKVKPDVVIDCLREKTGIAAFRNAL